MRNTLLMLLTLFAAGTVGAAPTQGPQTREATATAATPATAATKGSSGDGWSDTPREAAKTDVSAGQMRRSAAMGTRLVQLLGPSTSPRDQALRAALLHFPTVSAAPAAQAGEAGAILRRAASAGAADKLVQWMWANASDADAGCTSASPCPERDGALARIDPGNAAAWLPVLGRAWADDDAAGTDASLARMAAATGYDDFFVESSGAWVEVFGRFPEISAAQHDIAMASRAIADPDVTAIISGIAISSAFTIPDLAALTRACNRGKEPLADPMRFERCARIGRMMASRGTSMIAQMIGLAVIRRSGHWSADDAAVERVAKWRQAQSIRAIPSEQDAAAFKQYFSDLQSTGSESEAIARALTRRGIALAPPVGWDRSKATSVP